MIELEALFQFLEKKLIKQNKLTNPVISLL